MNRYLQAVMLVSAMTLALLAGGTRAEVLMVNGEHWVKSSDEQKKAYLFGVANMAQIEFAYQGPSPVHETQSAVTKMHKGLNGQTIDSVLAKLNAWYVAHADRLQQPVIETIWFEMVVPGLKKTASGDKP